MAKIHTECPGERVVFTVGHLYMFVPSSGHGLCNLQCELPYLGVANLIYGA